MGFANKEKEKKVRGGTPISLPCFFPGSSNHCVFMGSDVAPKIHCCKVLRDYSFLSCLDKCCCYKVQ